MAIKGKTVPSDAFLFTKRERPDFHSRETRLAALRLFEAGVGYVNASVKLGISMNTVRDWSRKYRKGTFEVDVPEKCFYYTKAVKRRIVKLRAKGLTWKELEEATGVSTSTCCKWVREAAEAEAQKEAVTVDSVERVTPGLPIVWTGTTKREIKNED